MTSKEKAKDLIANHKMQCRECGGNETAKIHSLIAVDEIISIVEWYDRRHISNQLNFWIDVKKELTIL